MAIVYDNLGGHDAFTQWAKKHRTEFYKIAARLIPLEIRDPDRDKINVIINRLPSRRTGGEPTSD